MTDKEQKISAHQKAASALLGVCKKYPELSVADLLLELEDGQYVSAKDGLVEIIEDKPFEEATGHEQPHESLKSLREAGLTIVGEEPIAQNGFSVAQTVQSCNDAVEAGVIICLTREPDMKPFCVLSEQTLIALLQDAEKNNPEIWARIDPDLILGACREQYGIKQPNDPLKENVELSFICLVYALAANLAPWQAIGEILEYFGAVLELYPDFIGFTDEVWSAFKAEPGKAAQS